MPDEKKDQDVNKKDELSQQDLDQASGGYVVHSPHESGRPDIVRPDGRLEHQAENGKR